MKKFLVGVCLSLMMMAGAAHAEQFYNQDSGQWTVEGFRGDLNYCAASTFWEDGSYFTFYVTDNETANVIVHNKSWNIADPIGNFKGYTATLRFFGKYPSEQGTIDYDLRDAQTIVLPNVNVEFLNDWTKFDAMNLIMPGDIGHMTIGLEGTKSAVGLMGDCLNQLDRKNGQNT